jgi:lysyl endopeptidase (lys-C)
MKRFLILIFYVSIYYTAYNQTSTNEKPISFGNTLGKALEQNIPNKVMPSLDMVRINREDKEDDINGVPPRFGYPHSVNYNLNNSGQWVNLPDGSRLWRLSISCPNALSINLLYDKFWLPDGAKFFVYSYDKKRTLGAFTSANNKGTKDKVQGFATGLVYGDKIVLEYYEPKNVRNQGIISIAYVVQGYRYINIYNGQKSLGASGNCNININCPEGKSWQKEKNAIALILVNGIRYCTGSLINTTANDSRPIFLTADHCLGGWATANKKYDAISDPNLDHWSFYWNYEAPSCINPTEEPTIYSTVGATILANNGYSDFALLSLKEDPRSNNSIKLYYLGWDRSGDSGNGGVGIHHPNGDIKKISQYTLTPQSTVYAENSTNSNGTHWRLIWSKGVTEGGSSGSPLINSNRKVIGQLHGGYSDCISNGIYGPDKPDWYGKFSVSWTGNGATDNRRKLQPWLDPQNTGVIVLDGKGTVPDTPADLLIRDYVGDDGEEPSYDPNDWLYKLLQHNPDIKLLDIDTQQPIHSIGMYKKKNCYIAVNIKNIGGKTTEGNGKERLHLFSQSYLITTLPKYALPYYERLTPTKGLPIGKLAYNEQKVAAGLFNWELPEKKLIATAERLKKAFPSVNNPIWCFDILAIADENGNSIIKSTADTIFIAHGAEDIARRYNSAAMGYWQRRTLWDDIFNQIIRILPTANVPFSLSLSQPVDIKRGRIKDFAEVNILLSNSLMTKLITAGNPKIKVIDQNRVRLLSADAKLEFRPVSNDRDDYFAGVEVKFFSDLLPQKNSFDFGLSYSEQGKEPEMVHFTAIRDSSVYFKAQAEASKTQVAGNETVTLTATNIGDEATYTWYNRSGNVIGIGTSITTVPTATDTYTLEVEREDNGYKSYGEVEVVALAGKIVSLSPNPAHSTLTVKYKLPDNAVIASIQITNIQNNISKTYAISTTATEKTISLEGLSVGSYIVKLIADGKKLHSQNLLIK